ncbi:hypothetical protein [Streptomyces spiralis]
MEERPGGIDVTVRVRRAHPDMFLRLHGSSLAGLPDDDGQSEWVTARMSYGVLRAVRQLLGFSGRVEVLSPLEAREELRAAVAAVAELYEGGTVIPASAGGPR